MSAKKPTAKAGNDTAKGGPDYIVSAKSGWKGAWKISAILGVIGLAASGFGFSVDPRRFAFSYLFAFFFFLTIALGALFFVLLQFITKAGWSVTVRRTAEFFLAGIPVICILVLPVIGSMDRLFPWLHETAEHGETVTKEIPETTPEAAAQPGAFGNGNEEGDKEPFALTQTYGGAKEMKTLQAHKSEEHHEVLEGKKGYLNRPFFLARALGYVVIWIWLGMRYFRWSTDQDKSKDVAITASAQRFAPLGLILFGTTVTFASFDWLMSLDPMWFSTIFGVTIVAGAAVANLALLILVTLLLRRSGYLRGDVNVEHYHDLGKLLFGWLVFWAYVSFAQFFLIWYANIPEEIGYFHHRWNDNGGTWKGMSLAIMILHFAVPFWLLMSRNVKRRLPSLALAAVILITMHAVEIYWIVLPNFGRLSFHWLDVTCFLGVGGAYFAAVLRALEGYPLIPVGDPRLVRALEFENA